MDHSAPGDDTPVPPVPLAPRRRPRRPAVASPVEVRDSHIHGRGVFAAGPIPAGSEIGRYDGRRYAAGETYDVDFDLAGPTYVFGLSDGSLIDGSQGGNATRHINHACAPNVEAIEHRDRRGRLGIRIHALRDIAPGEEVVLDYALAADGSPEQYRCRCGAPTCRGTMVALPVG